MKILIVEDNPIVTDTLRHKLKSYYEMDVAKNAEEGLEFIKINMYSAIVLDLGLPDMSGEKVCEIIRKNNTTIPILILSGRSEVKSKIELLNIGADDYVTKPFDFFEFKARLNVIIRRSKARTTLSKIKVDDLILDCESRQVRRGEDSIILRRREFDLLEYLMRNEGQVLTRLMIVEEIWDINEVGFANIVDVHIKHLRDKIDRPYNTKLIKTVHGLGYKLQYP